MCWLTGAAAQCCSSVVDLMEPERGKHSAGNRISGFRTAATACLVFKASNSVAKGRSLCPKLSTGSVHMFFYRLRFLRVFSHSTLRSLKGRGLLLLLDFSFSFGLLTLFDHFEADKYLGDVAPLWDSHLWLVCASGDWSAGQNAASTLPARSR